MDLTNLEQPSILQSISYEEILDKNISFLRDIIPDYKPLESDVYMPLLEAFSYKEMYLINLLNNSIKEMLLPYATGVNLDNLAVFYGIERLKGSFPYAKYEFSISSISSNDITIPKGLVLIDDSSQYIATLSEDITIQKGAISGVGIVELNIEVSSSEIKTELITTSLPFVISAKALEGFTLGSSVESDFEFRNRILMSLNRFSTAGSSGSYEYHTYSSDERISDVKVISERLGVVEVYISADLVDDMMITRVKEALNSDKVRPLTDKVEIYSANIINVDIKATCELYDISMQDSIDKSIKDSFVTKKIAEDLTTSNIIKNLHQNGVYRVVLDTPTTDIITTNKDVIKINSISITYTQVER